MEASWGHGQAPRFHGALPRNPSLHSNLGQQQNTNNLGQSLGEVRQVSGNCPQPASSMRLRAWEGAWSEEQKLVENTHFQQLRQEVDRLKECIGHLAKLLDSFCKESPVQNQHVGKQACRDKLEQINGTEKDPIEACSITTCRQRGEHNRMDVT